QAARPLTPGDVVHRDSASAASSMVSLGLFRVGSNEAGFSSSFPISLMRPGFSFAGGGPGSPCCGAGCAGSPCADGACWDVACDHANSAAIVIVSNVAAAIAKCARGFTL